jgi:hypothetical protein
MTMRLIFAFIRLCASTSARLVCGRNRWGVKASTSLGVLFAIGGLCYAADTAVPNDSLTPGAVASRDPTIVCTPGYARSQRLYRIDRRAYWEEVHAVLEAYHIPFADRHAYEIDHRVPLCLGGSNSMRNLWPQPLAQAHKKDDLEWAVCIAVCRDHTMTLDQGQRLFLAPADWRNARP